MAEMKGIGPTDEPPPLVDREAPRKQEKVKEEKQKTKPKPKHYKSAHSSVIATVVFSLALFGITCYTASPFDKGRAVDLEAGDDVLPSEEDGGWPGINTVLRFLVTVPLLVTLVFTLYFMQKQKQAPMIPCTIIYILAFFTMFVVFVLDCLAVDKEIDTFGDHKPYIATCAIDELVVLGLLFTADRVWALRKEIRKWEKLREDGTVYYKDGIQVSHDRVQAVHRAFDECDADGGGSIDVEELEALLKRFGGNEMTPEVIAQKMVQADADGDGTLDFDEFVTLLGWEKASSLSDTQSEEDLEYTEVQGLIPENSSGRSDKEESD